MFLHSAVIGQGQTFHKKFGLSQGLEPGREFVFGKSRVGRWQPFWVAADLGRQTRRRKADCQENKAAQPTRSFHVSAPSCLWAEDCSIRSCTASPSIRTGY